MKRESARERRRRGSRIAAAALMALCAVSVGALADDRPRVIPMPEPPKGPSIRRVTHDAADHALNPGAKLTITVLTEPGAKVTVNLGTAAEEIPCAAGKDDPGTFTCEVVVPENALGAQRVRARAMDARGRVSTLSAALPVMVEERVPWRETDALSVRLVPALFAPGSAELDAASRSVLAANLVLLKAHPQFPILLEGRIDASEPGDPSVLSSRRAEAVRDGLTALGIPKERIRISALAATQPLTASRDESERAVNRSVLFLLVPAPETAAP